MRCNQVESPSPFHPFWIVTQILHSGDSILSKNQTHIFPNFFPVTHNEIDPSRLHVSRQGRIGDSCIVA